MALRLEEFQHRVQRALVPLVVLVLILVLLKFVVILVDRIICQVHVQVVKVGIIGRLILLSRETRYAILMEVYA